MWWIILLAVGVPILAVLSVLWLFGERWRPIRASTKEFFKEGGFKRLLRLNLLHGYVYMRWSNQYIKYFINVLVAMRGRKWLAKSYHGKVLTQEHAENIVTLDVNQEVPFQDLEKVVPYERARDIVLSGPVDMAVYECICRHARSNPCQPTQVCMVIGQPFVDFVLEHNPHTSRKISQDEALAILREEHERGHVHTAWFKDAMLDRFYAICNCCSCCCSGMRAMKNMGIPMLASSGYVASVDPEKCTACVTCVETCPFDALHMDGDWAVVNWEKCMGCGVCEGQCPSEAIWLVRDERKGEPLDVKVLSRTKTQPI